MASTSLAVNKAAFQSSLKDFFHERLSCDWGATSSVTPPWKYDSLR